MDSSNLDYVSGEDIFEVINNNSDMLDSKKGVLLNNFISGFASLLAIPFVPLIAVILCCASFEQWYTRLFTSIIALVFTLPIITTICVIKLAIGLISAPLSLIFEGIPALFSKKYRQQFKLSRKVKQLYKYLNLKSNSVEEYLRDYNFYNPNVRLLLNEIEKLNKEMGRTNTSNTYDYESFTNSDNNQKANTQVIYTESNIKDKDKTDGKDL